MDQPAIYLSPAEKAVTYGQRRVQIASRVRLLAGPTQPAQPLLMPWHQQGFAQGRSRCSKWLMAPIEPLLAAAVRVAR